MQRAQSSERVRSLRGRGTNRTSRTNEENPHENNKPKRAAVARLRGMTAHALTRQVGNRREKV